MSPQDERTAKNETILRAANREIEHASEELGESRQSEIEVLCECGRAKCDALITLTIAEFEQARSQRDRFLVMPGHENPSIENVVERHDGYYVVDKFGEAEEIAESQGF